MARFRYTGDRTLIYFQYLDLDAQRTLVADPGGSYSLHAVEPDLAVPPGDGRWETEAEAPTSPPVIPTVASVVKPVVSSSAPDDKKASE